MNAILASNIDIKRAFGPYALLYARERCGNSDVPIILLVPACHSDKDGDRRVETMKLRETMERIEHPHYADLRGFWAGLDKYTMLMKHGDDDPVEHSVFDESMDAIVSTCDTVRSAWLRYNGEVVPVTRWGGFYPWHPKQWHKFGGPEHWEKVAERMAPMFHAMGSVCIQVYADTPDKNGLDGVEGLLAIKLEWCKKYLKGLPVTICMWHRARGELMPIEVFKDYCEIIHTEAEYNNVSDVALWSVDNSPFDEYPETADVLVPIHRERLKVFYDVFGESK